ncbi:MAG: non-homologous end-joining DNA ligase [Chthoniobacterales bacterium]
MTTKRQIEVEDHELTLSNLEKVYYPESGFTKGEVIGYYTAVAEVILPHLRDRPLTLKRYPEGIAGEHFYEKNAPRYRPDWVKTFAVPRSEGGPDIHYVLCNDRATLIWATNLADIEKHVLLARAPELHQPTSIVFDLDPGEPADILDCAEIALELKKLLESWGLHSYVKVSGSKGLHLSVPLNGGLPYEVTQPFAKTVAELLERQMPKRVVSEMAKSIRGSKVLIDWSQNSDFKTTVCVYALRAKGAGPLISLPVAWDELRRALQRKDPAALSFSPAAAVKRIGKLGDLFAPVLTLKQELPAAFTKALASGPAPKLSSWPRNRDKSLREYAAKRDFTRTAEPGAQVATTGASDKSRRFVIQKHAASHLHYDWRLEMQGVLRSWAVPKGPPTELREARLAMHVEDHPLDYERFEGTIAPGNYGAGTVMVWDCGEYQDITGNPAAAFHAGKMHIVMQGRKLRGEWILVKDTREPESNKWLLIKAGESMPPFSAKSDDISAISGRTMAAIAQAKEAQWKSNRLAVSSRTGPRPAAKRKRSKARFHAPMNCKAMAALPEDGGEWTFEMKFDGYRCLAVKDAAGVTLFSRNKKRLNARFPNVAEALGQLPGEFVIDGEIVALDEEGRPSFQLLQSNATRPLEVFFYVFDLLQRDGQDLLQAPIERRRAALHELLPEAADPLRFSPLLDGTPAQIVDAVRSLGLEGVVGKRKGSSYEAGERSGAWIKHRTDRQQEFVIGGYVPGNRGFDALLVGVYEAKRLRFVAKVKNGFVARVREEIFAQLQEGETSDCPFVNLPEKKGACRGDALTAEKMKACRWLKPTAVCQVSFVEWTDAGHLRHATFVALRNDRAPREVVRET